MNAFFKRQLTDYVEYHRDPWNCAMHVFGILCLFTAAVLPLSMWHVYAPIAVWSLTAIMIVIGIGFQVVGHRVFERRQPALVDNPTHLLLGPMFVMAKLFIAFGFRHDLAVILAQVPPQPPRRSSSYAEDHQVEPLPHS